MNLKVSFTYALINIIQLSLFLGLSHKFQENGHEGLQVATVPFHLLFKALLFPLMEEFIFRKPIGGTRNDILLSSIFCIILFFIVCAFYDSAHWIIGVILSLNLTLWIKPSLLKTKWIAYLFIALFSFGHISSNPSFHFYHVFILLGHAFSGFIYTFLRTNYSIKEAIFAHILTNGIPVMVVIFMD